jgi:RHS repeat-associated protein
MLILTMFAVPALLLAAEPVHTPAAQSGPYSWTTGPFQYDGSGNVTAIGQWSFAYDPLSRLATSHMTTPRTVDQTFTYDSFGNMTQQTTSGMATPIPTDAATNHLDGATYDEAGSVKQLNSTSPNHAYSFTYDALNSITTESLDGAPTSYYVYTADDERLRLETTTGATHWRVRGLDQRVFRDFQLYGTTWSVSRDYVYRGALLAAITPTTVENFSLDHLGSPRLVSDLVGNEIARHTYLPFGQELGLSTDGEPMKFTGHERDDDPAGGAGSLDYMHTRYYSGMEGRFLSVDSANATTRIPQSWNHYAYVHDAPLNYVDPDGQDWTEALFTMGETYLDAYTFSEEIDVTPDTASASIDVSPPPSGEGGFGVFLMNSARGITDMRNPVTGMTVGEHWTVSLHGAEAFVDGAIPDVPFCDVCDNYTDPFEKHGFYNVNDPGLRASQLAGVPTGIVGSSVVGGQIIRSAGLFKNSSLFAKTTGVLNKNDFLRVGWGWRGSQKAGEPIFRVVVGGRNFLKSVPAWLRHMDFW